MDLAALQSALAGPALAALSDADAAAALSAPIKTPRPEPITLATLGSVWGFARAAQFAGALAQAQAQVANPQLAALAVLSLNVLGGAGLNAADPQSQAAAQQFVALGLCTAAEVDGVYFSTSYRCGSPVSAADVAAARAALALARAEGDLRAAWAGVCQRGIGLIDAGARSGSLPTLDQLRQA